MSPIEISSMLCPCHHEETNTHIFLHLIHACMKVHRNATITTVVTDVVVLAVIAFYQHKLSDLWISFGRGKSFSYIPAHQIAFSVSVIVLIDINE